MMHVSVKTFRDAEVKRDEHVKDAGKLVTRATKYKDEAKREQKKVQTLNIPKLPDIKISGRWRKSGSKAWRKKLSKLGL